MDLHRLFLHLPFAGFAVVISWSIKFEEKLGHLMNEIIMKS
jgi:hypothetical protein